jgi:toxin FitB
VTIPTASDRVVVDSSGWVEYLGGGPKASGFAEYLESQATVYLPSVVVYEVHKKLYRESGATVANIFVSTAFNYGDRLIPLTLELALAASKISIQEKLPMADAIIYATAKRLNARLVTSDADFQNLPDVTIL